jgi:nitroreductase
MIDGMDLTEVMRTTGAVRRFTGEPLPDEVLERILDNARFAPTGGNRQGVRVVVVRERATREALVRLSGTGARRYLAQAARGENGWNPLHPPGPTDAEIAATEVPAAMTAPLVDAAVVLVVGVDLSVIAAMDQDLDRVGIVGGASVYPFVQNILLGLRHEGLGAAFTTLLVPAEPQIRELLAIPDEMLLAGHISVGHRADPWPRQLSRKPVSEFAYGDRYGEAW